MGRNLSAFYTLAFAVDGSEPIDFCNPLFYSAVASLVHKFHRAAKAYVFLSTDRGSRADICRRHLQEALCKP